VNTPLVNTSLVSFAQMLLVCNLRLISGKDAFEGEVFIGDAEDRLTGLFVGDGSIPWAVPGAMALVLLVSDRRRRVKTSQITRLTPKISGVDPGHGKHHSDLGYWTYAATYVIQRTAEKQIRFYLLKGAMRFT